MSDPRREWTSVRVYFDGEPVETACRILIEAAAGLEEARVSVDDEWGVPRVFVEGWRQPGPGETVQYPIPIPQDIDVTVIVEAPNAVARDAAQSSGAPRNERIDAYGSCPMCSSLWGYRGSYSMLYTHVIAIYSRELDRTVAWQCPHCQAQWARDVLDWSRRGT